MNICFESYYGTSTLGADYLEHHGIKGQRWGIRRFQNKDGTLTAAGKKRRATVLDAPDQETIDLLGRQRNSSQYVNRINDNDIIIKKGYELSRLASVGEPIDEKRKYVTVNDSDLNDYELGNPLGADTEYRYEVTNDIKVGSGRVLLNQLLKENGNELVKDVLSRARYKHTVGNTDFQKIYDKYKNVSMKEIFSTVDGDYDAYENSASTELGKEASFRLDAGREYVHKSLMKKTKLADKVFENLKADGYDAVIDLEDRISGASMPVIVLNPKNNLKIRKIYYGGYDLTSFYDELGKRRT